MRPRFKERNEGAGALHTPRKLLLGNAGLLTRFLENLGERFGKARNLSHFLNVLATIF